MGASNTLQDLAQALLKVLPTDVLNQGPAAKQPEVSASIPVEAPELPAPSPTSAVAPDVGTSDGVAAVASPPSGAPATPPLAPTQVEPSTVPHDPSSNTGADIEDAPTEPGDVDGTPLTKNDLKGMSEGVLACLFMFLMFLDFWIPSLGGSHC